MKTPPLLLGATLLFWGWQSHLIVPGAIMAVAIESARWTTPRWSFSDDDFNRIWKFCALLLLAATVYAFSANEGPSHFGGFFQNPNLRTERGVGTATARTMGSVLRWLPMIFFFFLAAQCFSTREGIPLETISLILRRRWKKAKQRGQELPAARSINISYPYLGLCLAAASIHPEVDKSFFWGMATLVAWGLWPHRSRSIAVWSSALLFALAIGYFGQGGLSHFRAYLETLNPQWLTGLARHGADPKQSKTALGEIGRVKGSSRIVVRLTTMGQNHPPSLLREASYRVWKGIAWSAGFSKDDFESVLPEKQDDTTFVLVPGKTNTAAVNIACYLDRPEDLLPLPEGSGRLEKLRIYTMGKNSAGAVLVKGPGLVLFDAYYGPGVTMDGPPDKREDISVSPKESDALAEVIENFQLAGATRQQTLRKVNAFFQDNFSYTTWQERSAMSSPDETPLSRFLLKSRKGHCEYFATATVLLLRQLKIPARYAVGYAVHEAAGAKYLVRQRDAHAWCLAWNDQKAIWEDFDTTPASWVETEGRRASRFEFLSDAWSRLVFEIAKLRWGQTHLRVYIFWVLIPILGFLLYQIVSRSARKRQPSRGRNEGYVSWPGLDSEFYALEHLLAARGFPRDKAEPLTSWLDKAAVGAAFHGTHSPLKHLLNLHYRYRFDPKGLTDSERSQLSREAAECLKQFQMRRGMRPL